MRKIITLLAVATLTLCCTTRNTDNAKQTIYVTITPLKALVGELTCGDYNVEVLVPKGASPETYEPTAMQLKALHDAELVFSTGLINFEQSLTSSIDNTIELSDNIELMEGSCSHNHCGNHNHGVDPHIWTSPQALQQMVETMRDAVVKLHPDSTKYCDAADRITKRLGFLDRYCKESLDAADVKTFMIYHPAYTYYARDYSIKQIAIEHDGKEPSPKQLTELIDIARRNNIKAILIQPQYNSDKVRAIAEVCGAEIVVTDPLAEDIEGEIRRITETISK